MQYPCGRTVIGVHVQGSDYEMVIQPFPDAKPLALAGQGDDRTTLLFLRSASVADDLDNLLSKFRLTPLLPLFLDAVTK